MHRAFIKKIIASVMAVTVMLSATACSDDAASAVEIESQPAVEVDLDEIEVINTEDGASSATIAGVIYPPNTTELDLSNMELKDISEIGNLQNLVSLKLTNNLITDITPLSKLTRLEQLEIDSNLIADLTPLAHLTSLKSLNISTNNISSLDPLADLINLESLNASWLSVDSAQPLKNMEKLVELDISNTNISDLSPLSNLINIQVINLNNLNDLKDISVLPNMSRIRYLDLSNNPLLTDITPIRTLTAIRELYLSNTNIQSFDVLKGFVKLTDLVVESEHFDQDNINMLKNMTDLKTLHLRYVSGTDISPVSTLKKLESLSVTSTEITDFSSFKSLTSLKSLDISFSYSDSLSFLPKLAGNLTKLNISGNIIDDWDNLLCLTKLDTLIMQATVSYDFYHLKKMTWLKSLDIGMIPESNYSDPLRKIDYLSSLTNLKQLTLDINRIEDVTPLESLTGLEYLSINGNRMTSTQSLTKLTNLTYLDISNNRFTDASPLCSMTQLETLKISGNDLEQSDLDALTESLVGCAIEFID